MQDNYQKIRYNISNLGKYKNDIWKYITKKQ